MTLIYTLIKRSCTYCFLYRQGVKDKTYTYEEVVPDSSENDEKGKNAILMIATATGGLIVIIAATILIRHKRKDRST